MCTYLTEISANANSVPVSTNQAYRVGGKGATVSNNQAYNVGVIVCTDEVTVSANPAYGVKNSVDNDSFDDYDYI